MKRYLVGFVFGVLFGTMASAYAVSILGNNGYVIGWIVTADGEEICHDPYIYVGTREIECD